MRSRGSTSVAWARSPNSAWTDVHPSRRSRRWSVQSPPRTARAVSSSSRSALRGRNPARNASRASRHADWRSKSGWGTRSPVSRRAPARSSRKKRTSAAEGMPARYQTPRGAHQAHRGDRARPGPATGGRPVPELHLSGLRHGGEALLEGRVALTGEPTLRIDHQAPGRQLARPRGVRQGRGHLPQCRARRPGHTQQSRRCQRGRGEERERLISGHACHVGPEAWQEPDATVSAALTVDGNPRRGERLDITQDGARRDLELTGEVRGRHRANFPGEDPQQCQQTMRANLGVDPPDDRQGQLP